MANNLRSHFGYIPRMGLMTSSLFKQEPKRQVHSLLYYVFLEQRSPLCQSHTSESLSPFQSSSCQWDRKCGCSSPRLLCPLKELNCCFLPLLVSSSRRDWPFLSEHHGSCFSNSVLPSLSNMTGCILYTECTLYGFVFL